MASYSILIAKKQKNNRVLDITLKETRPSKLITKFVYCTRWVLL
jgi:hypothetical protein